MKNKILFIAQLFIASCSLAQSTNISGVINDYVAVSGVSGTTIDVSSTSAFSPGDRVLLIQMQGATVDETNSASFGTVTSLNDAGNYEFSTVCTVVNGTQLTVSSVQRTYNVAGNVQLIRVPVYSSAIITSTLSAAPWDGSTGGILAFECSRTLTMNAGIDLQGMGFRGGGVTTSTYSCNWFTQVNDPYYDITDGRGAMKGEGISLYINGKTGGSGHQANAGGGGNDHNSGGGGGSNAGNGGFGGDRISASTFTCGSVSPGEGGTLNTYSNGVDRVFLGGGGGAGHVNNVGLGTPGSNGGGIVIIKADTVVGSGQTINCTGGPTPAISNDGSGGGGAGGTVLLEVNAYMGSFTVDVSGTNGGSVDNVGPSNCNGPGGGGGGGVLWINQGSLPGTITLSNTGGASGTTIGASQGNCTVGGTNGATNGDPGSLVTGLSLFDSSCAPSFVTQSNTICGTDSLFVGGAWQTSAGVYYDTVAAACCFTIYETTLSVSDTNLLSTDQIICGGDSLYVGGAWQTTSGVYVDQLQNVLGCDSLVETTLTVLSPLLGTVSDTICSGESVVVNGTTYNASNPTGTEVFTNIGPNSCDSTVTVNLHVISPDLSITNSSPTLTANQGNAIYQWLDCDLGYAPIAGATGQSYMASTGGNYAVQITQNGCTDTSACVLVSLTETMELVHEFISIHPNPFDESIFIDLGEEVHANVELSLMDLKGKLIQQETFKSASKLQWDVSVPSGVYLLRVEVPTLQTTFRIVKK